VFSFVGGEAGEVVLGEEALFAFDSDFMDSETRASMDLTVRFSAPRTRATRRSFKASSRMSVPIVRGLCVGGAGLVPG